MRTRQIANLDAAGYRALKYEAEYYSISPLIRKLEQCESLLRNDTCGDVMFQAHLKLDSKRDSPSHSPDSGKNNNAVIQIVAHHNAIAVARHHHVTCYRLKDSLGWQKIFESERVAKGISGLAFCYNCSNSSSLSHKLMLGVVQDKDKYIRLWSVRINPDHIEQGDVREIGKFQFQANEINALFFIGPRMVALGFDQGRVGVWLGSHSGSPSWLEQTLGQKSQRPSQVITAYDKVDCIKYCNFLLLGSKLGSLFLIDMQKFPLRLKDSEVLINELYEDPDKEEITAISFYLTRDKDCVGNSIEIAYGTIGGTVRVLIQHPETVGHGPQLFQTFKVHLNAISSVMLSDQYLISTCNKLHVRTWKLTRFRGLMSTQPGSTPYASFKIMKAASDEESELASSSAGAAAAVTGKHQAPTWQCTLSSHFAGVGPFGGQTDGDKQVFIEKITSHTDHINALVASSGQRICTLKSIDGSLVTSYCVHECEAGSRSRRYILTGHNNGGVQVWDLTTGFERLMNPAAGPSPAAGSLSMSDLVLELL